MSLLAYHGRRDQSEGASTTRESRFPWGFVVVDVVVGSKTVASATLIIRQKRVGDSPGGVSRGASAR